MRKGRGCRKAAFNGVKKMEELKPNKLKVGKQFLFLLAIALLVFLSSYLAFAFAKKVFPFSAPKWQVVQLINGDVFYGRLRTFPCCLLRNVYVIQQVPATEEEAPAPQLIPFNTFFFRPENAIRLSKEKILWWANLTEDSPILQTIRAQE